jgi:hypothetical protein
VVRSLYLLNIRLEKTPMKNYYSFAIRSLVLCFAVLAMTVAGLALSKPRPAYSGVGQEQRVRDLVEAFNARKIDAMLELVDDNVQWLHVSGTKVSVEAEGKAALRLSMERYFKSCPSCKSALEWVQGAGSRVTAMERASWTTKSLAKSQSSLSIYEFSGDKISRVYYFPAEADKPVPSK